MKNANKYPCTFSRKVKNINRKKHIAQIEQQCRWSESDIDLLLMYCRKFNLDICDVEVPFDILVALAFDARTPDNKAVELQEQVKKLALATTKRR